MNIREKALAIALGQDDAWRRIDTAREMLRVIEVGYLDDPPESLERYEEILNLIDEQDDKLRAWIKTTELGCRSRPHRYGPHMRYDIPVDNDSWRRLMCGAWLLWRVSMDDHEMRHDPGKPKRRLSDNWSPRDVAYDYSKWKDAGDDEDWDAWWREVFYTRPGRRHPGPSLGPLYDVYLLVRKWWIEYTGKKSFRLTYNAQTDFRNAGISPNSEDFNAPGRLFLAVAQALDGRYTATHCATVYDKWRKRGRK